MEISLFTGQKEKRIINDINELAKAIKSIADDTEIQTEEEKAREEAKIIAKLKQGKKLTEKELRFLRRHNPILYAHALRVQIAAKTVKQQLKSAKSKEEVDRVVSSFLGGIKKDDPDKEFLLTAVSRVAKEFRRSAAYERLPATVKEDNKEKKNKEKGWRDDKGPSDWTPIKEVLENLPQFSVGV